MVEHGNDKEKDDKNSDESLKGRGRKSIKEEDQDLEMKDEIASTEPKEGMASEVSKAVEIPVPKSTEAQPEKTEAVVKVEDNATKKGFDKKSKSESPQEETPDFIEKVISINRITKVTKGGKKLSFSALVVVGDTMGNVGYSLSKAREVATAIRKAMAAAKRDMIHVPLKGTTIAHEIIGQCSGSRVLLKPASEGTGVIASGPVRAVCDGAGIHNILTKVHRSNNPINVVKATIDGLSRLKKIQKTNVKEQDAITSN